jgi:predicted amidohydrolase YtcJ
MIKAIWMKISVASSWLLVVSLLLSAFLLAEEAAEEADLVLHNGSIWTVNDQQPEAEAVAIADDRIVYVGTTSGAQDWIGRNTRVIDLEGRFVTPGFIDNHVHFEATGQLLYGLNLLDVSEREAFAARIREVHGRYAPGTWITGGDWSAYETWTADEVGKAGREVDPDDA